jgi:peptide/nickel transport system substrate-binding protein
MKTVQQHRGSARYVAALRSAAALSATSLALAAIPAQAAYREAPALAQQVNEGKLPSVDKRLPEKPEVVKPLHSNGTYGGVLRSALRGNGDGNTVLRLLSPQGLVRWTPNFDGSVVPNVAEKWTMSPDAKEFVFYLRKGIKWSDGKPLTADDVLFAVNDIIANKGFYASPPARFSAGGAMGVAEKIDDYTVRMKFNAPYVGFLPMLATGFGQMPVMFPKHYCQQFHPKYNPKIDDEIKAARVQSWGPLMRMKCGDIEGNSRWSIVDKPTLDPWILKEPYTASATRVTLVRNPYFWQVDTVGAQLPYIDSLQLSVISEVETILLAAVNGQLDFQVRHIANIQNRPVLSDNAAKGRYKVLSLPDLNATSAAVFINQSTKNEKLRPLFRNKDFRIALSLAMDRKEISDLVFLSQAEPWQIGPAKANKFYNEKLAKQYTQLDLKQANALLDKIGLTTRDADGFRTYPGGGKVSMNAIVSIASGYQVEVLELMRKQWAKAGLDLVILSSERTLYYDRASANDFDLSMDSLSGGYDPTDNPRGVLALHAQESRQSLAWVKWYESGGKAGEEPSPSMKKRLQLYDQWKVASTEKEADELFKQILALAADEVEVLGTVRPPNDVGVRNIKLVNVLDTMPFGWTYPSPGPSLLQTWYYAK